MLLKLDWNELNDNNRVAADLMIAESLVRMSRTDEAGEYYNRVADSLTDNTVISLRVNSYFSYGNFLFEQGQIDKAIAFYRRVENICSRQSFNYFLVTARFNRACCHVEKLELAKAEKCVESTVEMNRKLRNERGLMNSQYLLGKINMYRQNYGMAAFYFRQARTIAEKQGLNYHKGFLFYELGKALLNQGRIDAVEPLLKESLRLNWEMMRPHQVFWARLYLAQLELVRENTDLCAQMIGEILEEALKCPKHEIAALICYTGYLAAKKGYGDPQRYISQFRKLQSELNEFSRLRVNAEVKWLDQAVAPDQKEYLIRTDSQFEQATLKEVEKCTSRKQDFEFFLDF